MPTTFHGGKLPAQPARPHLNATALLEEAHTLGMLPTPPPSILYADPAITWDMYGNADYGDCEEAGYGHYVNQTTFYGTGVEIKPTLTDVLGMYSAITGFNPKDPSTDQGTYTQDLLAYGRKTGLAGHKLIAYAAINAANPTTVKQAIAFFGQLLIGIQFPDTAMEQFNAGQDWDVVRGAKLEGGHCVLIVGYDQDGLDLITWGKRIRMTWAFWKKYTDEAWILFDADGITKAGTYFAGAPTLYALGQEFAALTGATNPIPQPAPTPTPVPTPVPGPAPADADKALAAAIRARRPAEDAWLTARGL